MTCNVHLLHGDNIVFDFVQCFIEHVEFEYILRF